MSRPCGFDHLGEIFPSGFGVEDLVHPAAVTAHDKDLPGQSPLEETRGSCGTDHFRID